MAAWHVMFGIGVGLLATIITVAMSLRQNRAIKQSPRNEYVTSPDDNCPICLFPMRNTIMAYLSCGHAIHEDCLDGLRRHKHSLCPICRMKINFT